MSVVLGLFSSESGNRLKVRDAFLKILKNILGLKGSVMCRTFTNSKQKVYRIQSDSLILKPKLIYSQFITG